MFSLLGKITPNICTNKYRYEVFIYASVYMLVCGVRDPDRMCVWICPNNFVSVCVCLYALLSKGY